MNDPKEPSHDDEEQQQLQLPVSGAGARSPTFTPTRTGTGTVEVLLDHEKLDVYQVTRELLEKLEPIYLRKLPRSSRDQLERASLSILTNIAEGAGKYSLADKQRYYEIARGSTTETAGILDGMRIRRFITVPEFQEFRSLLIRIAQMLSRMSSGPRVTRLS